MTIEYPNFISDKYFENNGDHCIGDYEIYMVFSRQPLRELFKELRSLIKYRSSESQFRICI